MSVFYPELSRDAKPYSQRVIVVVEISALWLWAVVGVRESCGAGELYFTSPECSLLINSVPDTGLAWPFVTYMLFLLGNFWELIIRLQT